MAKPIRIPIWKIVVLTLGCAVLSAALLFGSRAVLKESAGATAGTADAASRPVLPPAGEPPVDEAARSRANLSNLMQLIGLAAGAAALVGIGWLAYRYYLTIPAWKRRKGIPRRR